MNIPMLGNPDYTDAHNVLQYDHASQLGWETADAQHMASQLEANTSATLALAYEQRTASLMAFLMWDPASRDYDEAHAKLQAEIVARLGLGGSDA